MTVEIRPGTIADVYNVLARSSVAHVPGARRKMQLAFHASDVVRAGIIDHNLVSVWGISKTTFLTQRAVLWLLTIEKIETPFSFIRASQMEIQKLGEQYPVIVGTVAANSEMSQRWLRLLGFKIKKSNDPFYEIERSA